MDRTLDLRTESLNYEQSSSNGHERGGGATSLTAAGQRDRTPQTTKILPVLGCFVMGLTGGSVAVP